MVTETLLVTEVRHGCNTSGALRSVQATNSCAPRRPLRGGAARISGVNGNPLTGEAQASGRERQIPWLSRSTLRIKQGQSGWRNQSRSDRRHAPLVCSRTRGRRRESCIAAGPRFRGLRGPAGKTARAGWPGRAGTELNGRGLPAPRRVFVGIDVDRDPRAIEGRAAPERCGQDHHGRQCQTGPCGPEPGPEQTRRDGADQPGRSSCWHVESRYLCFKTSYQDTSPIVE